MPSVTFEQAQSMTIKSEDWLNKLSLYIGNPTEPAPTDVYGTQKFAFEIPKADLEAVLVNDRVVGILGYEADSNSLTVILVSVDKDGKPTAGVLPRQTWPMLDKPADLSTVLSTYLTP